MPDTPNAADDLAQFAAKNGLPFQLLVVKVMQENRAKDAEIARLRAARRRLEAIASDAAQALLLLKAPRGRPFRERHPAWDYVDHIRYNAERAIAEGAPDA